MSIGKTYIHVKERKSIFPFPESCPIFLESERKAEFFGKGGKELERKGKREKKFSSFPFLFKSVEKTMTLQISKRRDYEISLWNVD